MSHDNKKTYLSLIKPTGLPTLGNYLGALKYWAAPQEEFDCLYGVADLHAITVKTDPEALRRQSMSVFALLLAVGINPDKSILFVQSQISAHAELAWILGCFTMYGELARMTQFKDKSQKGESGISAGLFTYPALMAADILLYDADYVPVGEDQKQHVELCRDIAERVNAQYGEVFTLPEAYIPTTGARIKSLKDPTVKMSKSDGDNMGCIGLLDSRDEIINKFKRAVTDSEMLIRYAEGKEGINNLMTIYSAVTGKNNEEIQREFDGRGYGDFKLAVGEAVADELAPVIARYNELMADEPALLALMKQGAERAGAYAYHTLRRVKEKIGFVQ